MISFNNNKIIDGFQLNLELDEAGIIVAKDEKNDFIAPSIDNENKLWLAISEEDRIQAQQILDIHIPKPAPELSVEDKLASVGLNLNDLKAALGLS